jgi:sensor histidine kinase regulating citrate/malate metabolism
MVAVLRVPGEEASAAGARPEAPRGEPPVAAEVEVQVGEVEVGIEVGAVAEEVEEVEKEVGAVGWRKWRLGRWRR